METSFVDFRRRAISALRPLLKQYSLYVPADITPHLVVGVISQQSVSSSPLQGIKTEQIDTTYLARHTDDALLYVRRKLSSAPTLQRIGLIFAERVLLAAAAAARQDAEDMERHADEARRLLSKPVSKVVADQAAAHAGCA